MLPVIVIVVALAASVAVDVWLGVEIPAYGAGIGLIGTAILTFGSKLLAAMLKRPLDYYAHQDLPAPVEGEVDDG